MEIALPLLALGGLFVISNNQQPRGSGERRRGNRELDEEEVNREGFSSGGLPNTQTPAINYPTTNYPSLLDTVKEYPNPNAATDKYFDQNRYEQRVTGGMPVSDQMAQVYSLSGEYLDTREFTHKNMVPFFGGKIKGYTYDTQIAETVLDNMAGSGSQVIKKIEQAPLFAPEENVQWAYGAPNQSDFFQSRENASLRNNNVKPFETEMVAPGLNQGFTTGGSGGFNSGMESRDQWLPKTVDQMRVATNPKLEYSLNNLEGPAGSLVKNVGVLGRVEKQRPDRFYMNSSDRWFTTTGAEKGETLRPIQEMGIIRSPNCETNYIGPAGSIDKQGNYVPSAAEPTKREESQQLDVPHARAIGKGTHEDGDKWIASYTNYHNHRSTVAPSETVRSGFSAAIGAVVAPLLDILRPSRKEEVVHNVRVYGEPSQVLDGNYVLNPLDTTPTTIKQTTLYSPTFYIDGQKTREYVNNERPFDETQRDTTSTSYLGSSGGPGAQYGSQNLEAAYRQRNNDIKSQTIGNRTNVGNAKQFNSEYHVNIGRDDEDCFNTRLGPASSVFHRPPAKENYGAIRTPQAYNPDFDCERIDPGLLDAFRANPYTHSLTSSV